MAADLDHFRQIRTAIAAYRDDHGGQLPNWLSDLFPDYLSDPGILLCPVAERTGSAQLFGNDDPRMRTSYIYEFNARPASDFHVTDPTVRATMKDWKTKQMETFGTAVPLVRCLNHPRVLNLAVSGDIYETALFWETDPNTLALMARLGLRPAATADGRQWTVEVVDDEAGQPIRGARISTLVRGPTGYQPVEDAMTDAAGRSRVTLPGGTLRELRLEVTHPSFVSAGRTWQDETGLDLPPSHRVILERGIAIGGRVQDPAGNPIAGVEVSLHPAYRARAEETGAEAAPIQIPAVATDDQGEWRIDGISARLYRAFAGFNHPRFRRLQMATTQHEDAAQSAFSVAGLTNRTTVIVLQPKVELRLKAVDAETMEPLESFTVLQAYPTRSGLSWDPERVLIGHAGHAVLRLEEEHDQLPAFVQIQSPAHQPILSPRLRDVRSDQVLRLTLPKTRHLEGRVVDREGHAVPGAAVGLLTGLGSLALGPEGLEAGPGCIRTRSDADGRFRLPDAPDGIGLVAWHPEGLAETGLATFSRGPKLVLSAWGRVAGSLPPGQHGEAGVALIGATEHLPRLFPAAVPGVLQIEAETCLAEADENGRFVLDRVPPGRRVLWHPVLVGSEYPPIQEFFSFNGHWLEVKPGETTPLEVAPRSVRARLQAPDAGRKTGSSPGLMMVLLQRYGLAGQPQGRMIDWSQALGWVRLDSLDDTRAAPSEALITFSHDGQFRLEGVPAGRQRIRLRVFQPPELLGTAELEVAIPEAGAPVLLGTDGVVQLAAPRLTAIGGQLPDTTADGLGGGRVDLAELRGQPVWLHFWTSWSGAGQGSFSRLETALTTANGAPPARLVSVNLDQDPALGLRALEQGKFPGQHAHDGGWMISPLAEACGVQSLPWVAWFDAEGRLLGTGPAEPELPIVAR